MSKKDVPLLIRFIYTTILTLLAPVFLFSLYRNKPGKPDIGRRWREHFGLTPPLAVSDGVSVHPIWIHAVSVGEVLAATPLIRSLKKKRPEQLIVLTTTTTTGAEQAMKLGDLVIHRYMPLDFSFAIKRFVKIIQPTQLLIIETELWPNTLHYVAKANIPIKIINARLSERSCQRYARVQSVFNSLSQNITQLLCQYPDDAKRFIRLGVPETKIKITGSIKFDIDVSDNIKREGNQLRQQLGTTRPVWIAASTHRGEDELILEAHKQILQQHPNALLILVPRHPERFSTVFALCESLSFKTVQRTRSSLDSIDASTQVYLGDTMGELLVLIQASDICFMGGSLLGDKVGGHNPLEPAALGKPILMGPSYFNFTDITEKLKSASVCQIVEKESLSIAVTSLMLHDENHREMSQRAMDFVKANQGAIEKSIRLIIGD